MFVEEYQDEVHFIKEIGLRPIKLLGQGAYGCVYSVQDADGVYLAIKITKDTEEFNCIELIYESKAWEKTKHLPEIYKYGGPVKLIDAENFRAETEVFYYIRAELVDIPYQFWTDIDNASITDQTVDLAVLDIKQKTNICPADYHMRNWGFWHDELYDFYNGSRDEIPTYVLRDLSCVECELPMLELE